MQGQPEQAFGRRRRLVAPDEIDVGEQAMGLEINGVSHQRGTLSPMLWSPMFAVPNLSQLMLLEAGDLVNIETPPGAGTGPEPRSCCTEVIEQGTAGLGSQRHVCSSP